MKKIGLIIGIVFLLLIGQKLHADLASAKALALKLLEECNFTSDFGNPVITYEDVDDITNIGPSAKSGGPVIKHSELNAFKNTVVKKNTGKALLDKIKDTGGRVLYDPGFLHFMKKYMYIEDGGFDKHGNWHSRSIISSFPKNYDPGDKPHSKSFFLCLKPGWVFVPEVNYPPNKKSCHVCPNFCDTPPCEDVKKDIYDVDGDGDTDEMIPMKHHQPTNNVYQNLGNYLYGLVENGTSITKDESGKVFTVTFKDRTPPRINGCVGGKFPELGATNPANTGDWYLLDGLKVTDNHSKHVGTCLVMGKIDGFPDTKWEESIDWVKEEPFKVIESNTQVPYVIMPNSCHGVMLYSMFAWDKSGLLNPGEPKIEEDKPENCYGLTSPPPGCEDLGKNPGSAKPWPNDFTLSLTDGKLLTADPSAINANQKRGTGLINISDNDLPNIVIKFRSVKDGKSVFFPPVVQPLELPIFSSSEYKKSLLISDANVLEYENFLGDLTEAVFTSDLVNATKPIYFKILDILPSAVMHPGEHSLLERMKSPANIENQKFINKSFRLEDYKESDTDTNGAPIVGDEDTFGKRNGTGGEVIAVLTTPLQEDVEYLVSVWVDDNVKWATKDETGVVLPNIISIPTGITDGSIRIEIPNQLPKISRVIPLDPGYAVTPAIKVVFREPTLTASSNSVSFYHDKKFPFIEVFAKDFAGLTRKIKLFVSVSNEKPDIRIIERQHLRLD